MKSIGKQREVFTPENTGFLETYASLDSRIAYRKVTICSLCGIHHTDYYDENKAFLYSTPCQCELEKEMNERSQSISQIIYGEVAIDRNRNESGLGRSELAKLESPIAVDQFNKNIYAELINWVGEFRRGETHRGFYIFGSPGVGKTRLALEVADMLLAKGVKVYFTTANDYLHAMKAAIDGPQEFDVKKLATKADLLILDDMGAEQKASTFDSMEILSLINERAGVLPIIFTSNLSVANVDKFYGSNGRMSSRIAESTEKVFNLIGTDHRMENHRRRVESQGKGKVNQ